VRGEDCAVAVGVNVYFVVYVMSLLFFFFLMVDLNGNVILKNHLTSHSSRSLLGTLFLQIQ
jgi:hypothetical protein